VAIEGPDPARVPPNRSVLVLNLTLDLGRVRPNVLNPGRDQNRALNQVPVLAHTRVRDLDPDPGLSLGRVLGRDRHQGLDLVQDHHRSRVEVEVVPEVPATDQVGSVEAEAEVVAIAPPEDDEVTRRGDHSEEDTDITIGAVVVVLWVLAGAVHHHLGLVADRPPHTGVEHHQDLPEDALARQYIGVAEVAQGPHHPIPI